MATTQHRRAQGRSPAREAPSTGRHRAQERAGAPLAGRLGRSGWALLPLRLFLGATFTYAGLQKLASRTFFQASAPGSLQAQMQGAARGSPIRPLVTVAEHHAVLFGLVIAFGELAVGLGTLLGLWARAAAAGGALLSLSFFLTVSFHADPYYYGADIVFLFAWTPFILSGAGEILALDAILARIVRRQEGLAPHVPLPEPERLPSEAGRRLFLRQAGAAGVVGAGALVAGGVAAAAGRLVAPARSVAAAPTLGSGTGPSRSGPASSPSSSAPSASSPSTPPPSTAPTPKGTRLGPASDVPVGAAASFTDPAQGVPAYVVQPSAGDFRAFSAVCTHAGCTVQFSQSDETFQCPCHGAVYSAKTGEVLGGPAPAPLARIPVSEGPGGELYVDT